MSRKIILCLVILIMVISGCDAAPIEDLSVSLILGLDLDENDQLLVYMSSPVFNKEAKEKEEVYEVKTFSLRQSREKFDSRVMGLTVGSKTQIFLLGKRLLESKDWFNYIDPFFRDPKNTASARIVAVDGAVSDVIFAKPNDKPRLPLYLTNLIDTTAKRNLVKRTNLQDFRRQIKDKGRTPWIPEIKKDKRIEITGSALLSQSGNNKLSISLDENQLLTILEGKKKKDYSILVPVSLKSMQTSKPYMSFTIPNMKVKKKVVYNGRFIYDIDVKIKIAITEQLFAIDLEKESAQLEKSISKELKKEFSQLIRKIQKAQIDPLGLGLYARAYTYPEWKKVQDQWGETLEKAKINIHVNTEIKSIGTIR
ncbi:Ger(x)C family spore germination protein [Cytobacillus dafuensis]|uniref:Ger(X)C family spore germination protein n=1 Tax=Cytobacillus dafuensis TaxID=1742359 RepID=A0A5B8Z5L5_CYTDA|nr:Ger(x)C family spore germination protein [Cytobacillus dafuensis]QED46899.1 Ger(x)C family spore germination protein [Cytobacillus dafuensis]